MTSYHAWTHRPKAQGGTDPVPFPEGLSVAWLMHGNGSSAVPPDTFYDITAEGGAGMNPYEDGFISLADTAGFALDLENGWISWNVDGHYRIFAAVQVNSDHDGDRLSAGIETGSGGTFGGERTLNPWVGDAQLDGHRHTVEHEERSVNLGVTDRVCRFIFWHNSAGDASIESIFLAVTQVRRGLTGEFYTPS